VFDVSLINYFAFLCPSPQYTLIRDRVGITKTNHYCFCFGKEPIRLYIQRLIFVFDARREISLWTVYAYIYIYILCCVYTVVCPYYFRSENIFRGFYLLLIAAHMVFPSNYSFPRPYEPVFPSGFIGFYANRTCWPYRTICRDLTASSFAVI